MRMQPQGLLKKRCLLNYQRLQREHYTPQNVFRKESYSWYGDWEGRAILALAHASLSTGESMEHLLQIVRMLPAHFNEKGYLGPVYQDGINDEQQLAGHSWLLRGLLAYMRITGDDKVKKQIETMIKNLVLRAKGHYREYPVGCQDRALAGESMGDTTHSIVNGWVLSTDVGCAFILLDAITDVYEAFGSAELKALIDEMIARFFEIDVVEESFQTHATLTALRGVLRFMKVTGDYSRLDTVKARMQAYTGLAMTENYQNYNWFGIPMATEPCAVTDSFMVALDLWEITQNADWLDLAENIFYNGFLASQRDNGGFGCDECSGKAADAVYYAPFNYEAYWCCSMRGAEGLLRYLSESVLVRDNTLIFPVYNAFTAVVAHGALCKICHTTEYPYAGSGEIVLQTTGEFAGQIRLYIPKYTSHFSVSVNGKPTAFQTENGFAVVPVCVQGTACISYTFDLETKRQKALRYPGYTKRKGVLILGENPEKGVVPIMDACFTKTKCERKLQYRILYSEIL